MVRRKPNSHVEALDTLTRLEQRVKKQEELLARRKAKLEALLAQRANAKAQAMFSVLLDGLDPEDMKDATDRIDWAAFARASSGGLIPHLLPKDQTPEPDEAYKRFNEWYTQWERNQAQRPDPDDHSDDEQHDDILDSYLMDGGESEEDRRRRSADEHITTLPCDLDLARRERLVAILNCLAEHGPCTRREIKMYLPTATECRGSQRRASRIYDDLTYLLHHGHVIGSTQSVYDILVVPS